MHRGRISVELATCRRAYRWSRGVGRQTRRWSKAEGGESALVPGGTSGGARCQGSIGW
jgi:hypothetical protein